MNLGIDFGSTYSMLSYYNPVDDTVQAIQTEMGSKYIPSIACFDYNEELVTGQAAKELLACDPDLTAYRAFKMLLPECDWNILEPRGYTPECDPRRVAKEFLRQQITVAKDRCGVDRFENVVICIPEVWNKELYTMSGKSLLRDICRELDMADKVKVVSEPAAASAYFAYNYQKNTKEPYDGTILIVDYGGGTLDITLTKVNTVVRENGVHAMEIDVLGQTGAGENHGKQVGDAGIAYMEGVVAMAITDAGLPAPECDGQQLKAINILESFLMNKSQDLATRLKRKYGGNPERMGADDENFTSFRYKGKMIPVRYSTLYRAYCQIIQPVLSAQLDKVCSEYLQPMGIDPRQEVHKFKIALVGGFGQFALVQKQVWDYFHISSAASDTRLRDLNSAQEGRAVDSGKEDAISYGAALIASGVITMRKTAKLSVGLVSTQAGQETFDYAIGHRDELEYDTIYYLPKRIFYSGRRSDPAKPTWVFAIGQGTNRKKAYRLAPLEEKQAMLERISAGAYTFGFSVDDSDVYTFHIVPVDMDTGLPVEEQAKKLPLGNFSDIFGPNVCYRESDAIFKE